jgi:transketolase C-terminal domain/subunit
MIQSGLADPRKTFGAAVHEVARYNPDIVVLSADSGGSSGFKEFSLEYPERYHEFGIMEQGVMGYCQWISDHRQDTCFLCNRTFCHVPTV